MSMIFPDHWDELACISHLQRRIILYSIAYYEFDCSPISDYEYDKMAHELVDRMRRCNNVEDSRYYYAFYDYDGSTGFNLYSRLTDADKEPLMYISRTALGKNYD